MHILVEATQFSQKPSSQTDGKKKGKFPDKVFGSSLGLHGWIFLHLLCLFSPERHFGNEAKLLPQLPGTGEDGQGATAGV